MRKLPVMEAVWRSGQFVGDERRPFARVTVQRPKMALRNYSLMSTFRPIPVANSGTNSILNPGIVQTIDPYHGRKVSQTYADFMFTPPEAPKELPNVRSVSWQRSLGQDVATLTLELYNSAPRDEGQALPSGGRIALDSPGYYTYNRGKTSYSRRWGHVANEWAGLVMPDNLLRTYEGYGVDKTRAAEFDPHLAQTGVWLIDTVQLNAIGLIVITARDVGRLLIDHQVNQPVIPPDWDGAGWAPWGKVPGTPQRTRIKLKIADHSNRYGPFKGSDGELHDSLPNPDYYRGHRPTDILDDNPATYWMSFAHIKPRWPWGVEWIEVSLPPSAVETIQMWTVGSGYTCYVSVYADGAWRNAKGLPAGSGDKKIAWSANPTNPERDQDAIKPYVKQFVVGKDMAGGLRTVTLPVTIQKVTRIRLSFVNLQHLPGVPPAHNSYRFGLRSLRVNGPATSREVDMRKGPTGANPGRYSDYSDIVKMMCAWAGFFWPRGGYVRTSDGRTYQPRMTRADSVLAVDGRVWGDFEPVYTVGPAEIGRAVFDNKSCMDVISYLREMIGYVFYIDEVGAAQWRLPNIYEAGNWLQDERMNATRTVRATVIDERQVLLGLDATVDSKNLREIIRVSNNITTAQVAGFVPNDVGLRRVLTWNEWRFEDADVQRAADMTAIRSLFTYRQDRVVIPGFPGIQIDDQIVISERLTSEGVRHYVSGISSSNNLETGEWTYTITTHWLGDDPDHVWAVPRDQVPESVTRAFAKKARPEFRNPNLEDE